MLIKCSRLHSYFKFMRVSIFILVLITIHAWLKISLSAILITRLTNSAIGLSLPKAASIVNVQDGLSAFLLLLVAYVSETMLGCFGTVLFTTLFYLVGLLLLYILATKENEGVSYLFMATMLIALGRSGNEIPLKEFLADQCKAEWSVDDEEQIEFYRRIYWWIGCIAGTIVSICLAWIYKDMAWVVQCKISTIAMGAGLAFFLAGLPFYHTIKSPQRNDKSVALQLLWAAMRKKHLVLNNTNRHKWIDTTFRWVDRAAIIEPSISIEEQLRRGRLHTVEQVNEVKKMLSLIPLWTAFLVYGLLHATASIFFYHQAEYMNPQVGVINNIPVEIFVVITISVSFIVSYVCEKWFQSYWGYRKSPRHVMLIRIGAGLAIAPICCVVAWRVESYRLEKLVKTDTAIGVVWLTPQFILLGFLDGLICDGMEEFFSANVLKSFRKYGPSFTQFAPNIGHFISLALVFNLGSLFGDSLDTSILGWYYAILGYICFVNFMFYCFLATHFVKPYAQEVAAEQFLNVEDQMMMVEIQNQLEGNITST